MTTPTKAPTTPRSRNSKPKGGNPTAMELPGMIAASAPAVTAALAPMLPEEGQELTMDTPEALAPLFDLAPGDVVQMAALMPGLSQEALEATVILSKPGEVRLRFSYYGVMLFNRTCTRTATSFLWS